MTIRYEFHRGSGRSQAAKRRIRHLKRDVVQDFRRWAGVDAEFTLDSPEFLLNSGASSAEVMELNRLGPKRRKTDTKTCGENPVNCAPMPASRSALKSAPKSEMPVLRRAGRTLGVALLSLGAILSLGVGKVALATSESPVGLQMSSSIDGVGMQTAESKRPSSAPEPTPGTAPDAASSAGRDGEHRIDAGDRVTVSVYREPDLNIKDVRVRDSGTISFPLIGELNVRGLTSNGLTQLITKKLADGFLRKPSVSVSIEAYRLYYIKGEVTKPGGYNYMDGLTIEKAVALAGGFTERASESNISLVREEFDSSSMKKVSPNMKVLPGDVITVGESFF